MLPNVQKKLNIFILMIAVAAVFSLPVAVIAQEVNDVNFMDDPNLFAELRMPGTIEGMGTYFEVTDSNYLNITFESSEGVHLILESVPEMVVMEIEAAEGATSTQIILGGFEPSTTYYKYEDDYHNLVTFTTDVNGSYTYTLDLTERHLVFIQPRASTIFLSASGWSDPTVGTWDATTQTGTLTTDVYETIQIDSDGITLDGNGKTITGSNTGHGVLLNGRTGVTIKNVNVQRFTYAIVLVYCNSITLTDNRVLNNSYGIYLRDSGNSTLTYNTTSNGSYGIKLSASQSNTLTDNTASNHSSSGIFLEKSSYNILTDNTTTLINGYGIYLAHSKYSTLTNNTASNNSSGIYVRYSGNSTLTDNTASNNGGYGISLGYSGGSTLSANIMSDNKYNFHVQGSSDSHFENDIDITNTVDGRPVYYIKDAVGNVYDGSTNAGTFYAINCYDITVKDLTLTQNGYGLLFWKTPNSRIENVTASDNYFGIYLVYCNSSTLTDNTVSNNTPYGIYLGYCNSSTLTNNTALNNLYGINLGSCNSSTLTDNTASGGVCGIYLSGSGSNTLTNNTASNNTIGISLWTSSGNTLANNIASLNENGIYLLRSNNNTLRWNTVAGNSYGIYLTEYCSDNQIYNNNFVDNWIQARVRFCTGNVFNLPKPIGGNYWSDWTSPDDDGDWFVDFPYVFDGGQDDLPWVRQDGWVAPRAIQALAVQVMTLNLHNGIENSLDAKLDAALKALDDVNANNDVAAINAIEAFINAVEAQSGNQIPTEDADALIAAAQEIIAVLSGM